MDQQTPQQPEMKVREMIVFLNGEGFRVTRSLPEKDIREMFNIVFGTSAERKRRLPPNTGDCFGDFDEALEKQGACQLADARCMLLNACRRVTFLQHLAEEKELELKQETDAASTLAPDPDPVGEPVEKPKAPKVKKDPYGFVEGSKGSVLAKMLLDGRMEKTFGQLITDAANARHVPEQEVKVEWYRLRYVMETRGFKFTMNDSGRLVVEKVKK
jgi:hypothetical protein